MNLTTRFGLVAGTTALALAGSAFGGAAADNDALAQIAELKNELAQLKAQNGEDWLTEQRAGEIRGIVQDVLADSQNRTSLQNSGAMAGATTLFVLGSRTVDYADAIAILYAYPFLLVIMAVLFLKERAGWPVWIGVTSGFVGVLLVIRPEFEEINMGAILIFLCAVVLSIQLTLSRRLGAVSPPLITAFAGAVCATIVLTFFLPGSWQAIPDSAWPYIWLLILTGTVNQVLLVYAFADSEASTLAPFTYVEIVAAVTFGFLFFSTLPSFISWIGIGLIAASGIYVARAR